MIKRTSEQWYELFAQQMASGLSAQQFCKQNDLCPKHFSVRKKQLGFVTPKASGDFIRVVKKKTSLPPPVSRDKDIQCIFRRGDCTLHFDAIPSTEWLAQLLRALQ